MIAIVGVILMIVIVSVVYGMQSSGRHKPIQQETETETVTEVPETELEKEVSVDGISITGMSREEARQTLIDHYPWAMKAQYQDDTYEITNLMTVKIDGLLDEIYSSEPKNIFSDLIVKESGGSIDCSCLAYSPPNEYVNSHALKYLSITANGIGPISSRN